MEVLTSPEGSWYGGSVEGRRDSRSWVEVGEVPLLPLVLVVVVSEREVGRGLLDVLWRQAGWVSEGLMGREGRGSVPQGVLVREVGAGEGRRGREDIHGRRGCNSKSFKQDTLRCHGGW